MTNHESDKVFSGSILRTSRFLNLSERVLPLTNVTYQAPSLRFGFPNGEDTISFEGTIHDDRIIGRVVMREQIYPWVMTTTD